ncbi:hypothetical protein [Streptomyces cavourensis]|uniref:hypothetical protein n=1 Tax=Streptomyces cavourensis TaxID=67258 RepID=UPI001F07E6F0|nr:hypothetical protein [Streptomyces cavourensis]
MSSPVRPSTNPCPATGTSSATAKPVATVITPTSQRTGLCRVRSFSSAPFMTGARAWS